MSVPQPSVIQHVSPATKQTMAHAIRFLAVDAILAAGEGHQGVPLGMADIATALYTDHLKHDPKNPSWFDRDRVVLSNGHGSMLLYALLYLSGYEKIDLEQIKRFRQLGAHTAGHPEYDPQAGIEVTTGLLGQGIGNALGMAIAEAHLRAEFGVQTCNHHTYAFVGDGCLQEGIGQEMIALAGHLGLGHLIVLWDDNEITDDGATHLSISENVAQRFRVANWHVVEVDGHDIQAVSHAIAQAKLDPRPSMIACKTTIAKGVARLQGQRGGHSGKLFSEDRVLMQQLFSWPHGSFEVPPDVLTTWRSAAIQSSTAHIEWQQHVNRLSPSQRSVFENRMGNHFPILDSVFDDLSAALIAQASATPLGGISLSAAIHAALTPHLPQRMTACADLEAPTDHKRGLAAFTSTTSEGNYIHCGVREHVMGALCNGMAAHGGILPVSVTYLAFSDYMRPTLRMAALMGLPVKFVFSHDSIGIGKNGPTHQPVEILASLRVMPNLQVLRPADAAEAVACWQMALENTQGPSALIFARQALPNVSTVALAKQCARGAYVVSPEKTHTQLTLIATGSEVNIALEAQRELLALGMDSRVVSMPCKELFEAQEAVYQSLVVSPNGVNIVVEAAVSQGWERYTYPRGAFIGMQGYGLSGSAQDLYQHFGITAQAVVKAAQTIITHSDFTQP
jgi:transketolase